MSKYVYDPDIYRELPIYSRIIQLIKAINNSPKKPGEKINTSILLANALSAEYNIELSSIIISKCYTITDIVNYIKYVRDNYGRSYYFDATVVNRKRR